MPSNQMEIEGHSVWQVACGDTNRDFHDVFLRWDVILVGPGNFGDFAKHKEDYKKNNVSNSKINDLIRFTQIKEDDWIVLRLGTKIIYGIGQVKGNYEWHDEFGDIDGWDLQHVRRVVWHWKYESDKIDDIYKKLGSILNKRPLKWGATIQTVNPELKELKDLIIDIKKTIASYKPIRLPEAENSTVQIDFVINSIQNNQFHLSYDFRSDFKKILNINNWYDANGIAPSEAESINVFIIPLLNALGWSHEKIAIEWNHIDIVLFNTIEDRKNSKPIMIIEAKKRWDSFLTAKKQADGYAKESNCDRIIVTNGICYSIYLRDKNNCFNDEPSAYLNTQRMKNSYPILGEGCKGATEALFMMSPYWKK